MQTRLLPLLLLLLACAVLGCRAPSDDDDRVGTDDDDSVDTSNLYGPENRWRYATNDEVPDSRGDLDGLYVDELATDFLFVDQFGDEVRLHQFTGRLVVFEQAAMWCEPCVDEAPRLSAFAEAQREDGVMLVTWVQQNEQGQLASAEDAARWATMTNAAHPVLSLAPDQELTTGAGFPWVTIIRHDMQVLAVESPPFSYEAFERAAAGTPGMAEICDDGIDNDVDLTTDCADGNCLSELLCEPMEQSGGIAPCGPLSSVADIWEITAPQGAAVEVDTRDPATPFDPLIVTLPSADWDADAAVLIADDEFVCTARPEQGSCPRGFVPAGTSWIAVGGSDAGYDEDAGCNGRSSGTYELVLRGGATAALVGDDVRTGPDPSPYPTGPGHTPAAAGTLGLEVLDGGGFSEGVFTVDTVRCDEFSGSPYIEAWFTEPGGRRVLITFQPGANDGSFWPVADFFAETGPAEYRGQIETFLDPDFPEVGDTMDPFSGRLAISDAEPRQLEFAEIAYAGLSGIAGLIASGSFACPEEPGQ